VCLVVSAPAVAQDKPVGTAGMSAEEKAMMDAMIKAGTPGANHELLASMAGEWAFKSRMWMNPSAPPAESSGTATYTTLYGGRYVEGQYKGEMMGMPFEGRGLMGYDNVSGRFQTTWADNMGTMIMFMEGRHDAAAKTITYTGEMDDIMKPGTKVKVRQVIRLASPDSHVMEWFETRGGKETKMMEIAYTRNK
jgi:hypothetical protein